MSSARLLNDISLSKKLHYSEKKLFWQPSEAAGLLPQISSDLSCGSRKASIVEIHASDPAALDESGASEMDIEADRG